MNLKMKFHLASASLILTVVLGMTASLFYSETKELQSRFQTEQAEDLLKLARVYEEASFTRNDTIYLNYVKTLIRSPKIAHAGHLSVDGTGWIWWDDQPGLDLSDESLEDLGVMSDNTGIMRGESVRDGRRIIELTQRVHDQNKKYIGVVRLGYSKDELDRIFHASVKQTLKRFAIFALIAIAFGLMLAQLFSAALARPINHLMKAALDIAKGKKGVQIPEQGKDELGQLTRTFNEMSRELTKLDSLKDDFMSHVTHELRSPLTSIIATVELLNEMPMAAKDPKFRRSIDRLMYGSERLNRLVDNILDLTRMEAGKMQFDIQPTDIGQIVTEMADFFEPRAMEKGLKITAIVPPQLRLVMADPEKIRQVLSNLIYNAIKFTNTGGIVVWAREKEGQMHVGVQDTGVGIPKDKINSLFQKFETLKDTRDRVNKPVPGTGLGLNIVKNSLQAQGGKIWVESEIDKGSTFIFSLPLAAANSQIRPAVVANAPREARPASENNPRPPVILTDKEQGEKKATL